MECSTILAEMQVPREAKGVTEGSLYEALKRVKDKAELSGETIPRGGGADVTGAGQIGGSGQTQRDCGMGEVAGGDVKGAVAIISRESAVCEHVSLCE